MEFNEIEKSVLRDLNPPKEMEPQDKNCWYALRGLYQVYHAQSISRDQAKKAKLEIAENHARICRLHNQYFASVSQTQEFIRRASRYRYDIIRLSPRMRWSAQCLRKTLRNGSSEKNWRINRNER